MQEIRFTVWQFVRLMVQLEETIKKDKTGPTKKLYDAWEDIWVELDAKLLDFGRDKPDEFADLMMNQEVCCEEVTFEERKLIILEFKKVMQTLKQELAKADDDQTVEDLTFELDELVLFSKELKSMK